MSRIDFVTGAPEKYAHLVDALAKVPEEINAIIAGKSPSAMNRAPAEGEWSAHQVLAHMSTYAGFQDTWIRQVATMTDPAPPAFSRNDAMDAVTSQSSAALAQLLEANIGRTVDFLSGTPDASWGRPGRLRNGRRSLRQIVEAHIAHMNEHVAQTQAALSPAPARV